MKIRNGFVSNSSTSSFVCDVKLSITEVKEILQKMINFYNDLYGGNSSFEYMFKEPFEGSDEQDKFYIDYFGEKEILRYLTNNTTKGKIIIEGSEDNSVPYVLTEIIKDKFNAERYHLG